MSKYKKIIEENLEEIEIDKTIEIYNCFNASTDYYNESNDVKHCPFYIKIASLNDDGTISEYGNYCCLAGKPLTKETLEEIEEGGSKPDFCPLINDNFLMKGKVDI